MNTAGAFTQAFRPHIGSFHLRRRKTFGRDKSGPERGLKEDFLLELLGAFRQAPQQLHSLGQVANRLLIGRSLERPLTGSQPEWDRLFDQAGLGVVSRE